MELLLGNCLDRLKELKDNSVDAIVTDPPYGLSFMGKKWDYDVPSVQIWKECLRVLKPGGYLLSFAGTRTQHRMAVNIEDAGFEIRDMIAWVYGSGFPKSLNIGKAVDKLQGNEREVVDTYKIGGMTPDRENFGANDRSGGKGMGFRPGEIKNTKGTSEWEGWGTALKPALEPITVARKPIEGTVAENCLKWGVGGINIDGCRVGTTDTYKANGMKSLGVMHDDNWKPKEIKQEMSSLGRFPANLIHDGSDEVVGLFPNTGKGSDKPRNRNTIGSFGMPNDTSSEYADSGSAARFFYTAKASKRERNIGCEGLEEKQNKFGNQRNGEDLGNGSVNDKFTTQPKANNHPTVKPIALMEYLVKMVSREGQVVLDPFMGSGSTGMACKKLNRDFIGIEMIEEYMEIAKCRIKGVKKSEQLNMI